MTNLSAGQSVLDAYIRQLESLLRPLPREQVRDITDELESHIRESSGSSELTEERVTAVLTQLGRPQQLASMYLAEDFTRRAARHPSPWLVLKACARWAKLSIAGGLVFLACLMGYGLAAVWLVAALAKPFEPASVGLWRLPDPTDELSFSLSLGSASHPGARELLGWWLIPLGLSLAAGIAMLTTRFGLWSLRRLSRKGRP